MRNPVVIENIEALRDGGITDVELRDEIRSLEIGDFVNLTFLTESSGRGETLSVQITDIQASTFSGRLAHRPTVSGLAKIRPGEIVTFGAAHIHSLPKSRPPNE